MTNIKGSETFSGSQHVSAALMALQFLTIFPVTNVPQQDKGTAGLSLLYYPVVGLLLGFVLAVAAWLMQSVLSPFSLQVFLLAALLLTLWVALTGALHLDGLADCADAWMGGFTCDKADSRPRTLALMKDPTSGPIAIAVVVLLLLIKFAALVALLVYASLWLLLLAPFVARLALLALMLTTPYVRPQGLGETLSRHVPRQEAKIVMAIMVAILLLLSFSHALPVLLVTAVVLLALRIMMMSRLRGCTGDTLGATVEIVETVSLVMLVMLL